MLAQPKTIAESISRRLDNARYIKNPKELFIRGLLRDIEKLESIEPDVAWGFKGYVYAIAELPKKALDAYQTAVRFNPSAANMYNVGLAFEDIGDLERARINYQKALTQCMNEGDNISVLNALADRYIAFFDYEHLAKLNKELKGIRQDREDVQILLSMQSVFKDQFIMLDFGQLVNQILRRYIKLRFISGTRFTVIDDCLHLSFLVKCSSEDDVNNLVTCNLNLSDEITEFEQKYSVNLEKLCVYCEGVEI